MRKSLDLDPNLKIEKKSIYEDLKISKSTENDNTIEENAQVEISKGKSGVESTKFEIEENIKDVKDQLLQLEFKWEKKSTGSTDSLLESDSDADDENIDVNNLENITVSMTNEKILKESEVLDDEAKKEPEPEPENQEQGEEDIKDVRPKELDYERNNDDYMLNQEEIKTVEPSKDDNIAKVVEEEKINLDERKSSPVINSKNETTLNKDRSFSQISLKSRST